MKKILITSLLLAAVSSSAHAAYSLPAYPKLGSDEESREVAELLQFQKTRTSAECIRAAYEVDVNLETFYGPKYGPLTADETAKLAPLFEKIRIATNNIVQAEKVNFDRPRPYVAHSEIKPCVNLEWTKAYPSGHAAISRVFALALTKLHPEKKEIFMNRAEEIARDRVLSGVHHPSDITEGKKLGDHIFNEAIEGML